MSSFSRTNKTLFVSELLTDLNFDVVVVAHAFDLRAHVALGHVVVAVLVPFVAVAEVAQLLPGNKIDKN